MVVLFFSLAFLVSASFFFSCFGKAPAVVELPLVFMSPFPVVGTLLKKLMAPEAKGVPRKQRKVRKSSVLGQMSVIKSLTASAVAAGWLGKLFSWSFSFSL